MDGSNLNAIHPVEGNALFSRDAAGPSVPDTGPIVNQPGGILHPS